jgi:uncharacterized hydrophobic protein (TIGR00271 family)
MFGFKKIKGDHLFRDVDEKNRQQVVENIIEASRPRKSFFVMVAAASFICTAGLLMDSVALIIGAMIIAPMISALLSVSLGIVVFNGRLFFRSVLVVLKALALLFVSAFGISMLFETSEIIPYIDLLKSNFQLEIFAVALLVGFVAAISFIRKELSQYITGTAIAVTLIPPMCISAIALRMNHYDYFLNSLWIFFINFSGIILSSILVFIATGFYRSKARVIKELEEEAEFLSKLSRRDRIKKWFIEGLDLTLNFFKKNK